MSAIGRASFIPLREFPLRWRFAAERHTLLGPDLIGRLRPLRGDAAAAIDAQAMSRLQVAGVDITFRSDDSPGIVHDRLRGLPPAGDAPIIVSWDRDTALVTDWSLFVAHWDDFCYPASDDVTVWSMYDDWTLSYRHYEVFQFSRGARGG